MGVTMTDIAISTERRLYGISGGNLYRINACNAEVTLLGPSTSGTGLCADVTTGGLFAQGPPLERIPLPQTTPEVVGGACCGPAPAWCGPASGDLSASHRAAWLYDSLACPSCPGDTLVRIDTGAGALLEERACLYDRLTLEPLSGITGLAFDPCSCGIWVGRPDSDLVYEVATVGPFIGGGGGTPGGHSYTGTFGFAVLPVDLHDCTQPPACEASAEAPDCWSVQLHAEASDADGDEVTLAWTSDCAGASFAPSASDPDAIATVDAGCRTCRFDLVVTDSTGRTCDDFVEVTFVGGEALDLDARARVSCLWPPNHALVDIGLEASVTGGGCGGPGGVALSVVSVTSDESPGDALGAGGRVHCPDAVFDGMSVKLRAERSGVGDGRVYRVTVRGVDSCGNMAEDVVEVRVPHDRRRRDAAGPCPAEGGGARHVATDCP